jgi:hypothetical protein
LLLSSVNNNIGNGGYPIGGIDQPGILPRGEAFHEGDSKMPKIIEDIEKNIHLVNELPKG